MKPKMELTQRPEGNYRITAYDFVRSSEIRRALRKSLIQAGIGQETAEVIADAAEIRHRPLYAHATCAPEDTFDPEYGSVLALNRLNAKKAQKIRKEVNKFLVKIFPG